MFPIAQLENFPYLESIPSGLFSVNYGHVTAVLCGTCNSGDFRATGTPRHRPRETGNNRD